MPDCLQVLMKVLKAGPALWPAMFRAGCELALARVRHGKLDAGDLLRGELLPKGRGNSLAIDQDAALIDRVAALIPRVARRLPWRSDCLIQAMAAQRWLSRSGIASSIRLGTRTTPAKGFEAHAWLIVGERVVIGSDIEGFAEFAAFPGGK